MPTSTSPYQNNDYQAASAYRPYQLPINDIFKAYSAVNEFWDAGARRVKSVYDNALDLKLSLAPNREIRDQFMKDAEKQIVKLSSMDLSDPSVQRQGFGIFKPVFQDEGILYDDLTTKHYEKVRADALSYRQSNNGKGYSDVNFAYAMDGYQEFVGSQDRMAGKKFYEKRKEYTPYYDYTEDFSKSLKECKPSSIETQSPNYGNNGALTGYMKENYNKTLSAAQVRGCLESGLSPNAVRQLQIEGSVAYKNKPAVLAADTVTYLSSVNDNLAAQLQELAAKKAVLNSDKTLDTAQKKQISDNVDAQMKNLSQEIDKSKLTINKLSAGDFSPLNEDYEGYAGTIHSYKKVYKKAVASSFSEVREIYKSDPTQLNAIRFSQEKYLRALDFNYDVSLEGMKQEHDKEMKLLDLMYGSKDKPNGAPMFKNPLTGEWMINPNLTRESANLNEGQVPEKNEKIYEQLNDQLNSLNSQDSSNNLQLYNNVIERANKDQDFRETLLKGFNYGTTEDEWERFKNSTRNNTFTITSKGGIKGGLQETSWFKAYSGLKPNDEDIQGWAYTNTITKAAANTLKRKLEIGEQQVAKELGGGFREKLSEATKGISSVNIGGTVITPMDIQDAIEGKSNKVKIITGNSFVPGLGGGTVVAPQVKGFVVNGKTYSLHTLSGGLGNSKEFDLLENLTWNLQSKSRDVNKVLKNKRVEVYNKLGFNRDPWFLTFDDKSDMAQQVRALFPTTTENGDEQADKSVAITGSDFAGGIKVTLPSSVGKTEALEKIRARGIGTNAEIGPDGNTIIIKGTNYNVIPQAVNNPILKDAAFQLMTIGETSEFRMAQPGQRIASADIEVPVMVNGKQETLTIETYKRDNSPEYRIYAHTPTGQKVIAKANNAYDLFEKLARTPFDLNKPIK